MKNKILTSLLVLTASGALASEVKVGLGNGSGSISGVITTQNKFRVNDIQELGSRDLKVSGDLFKGQSTEEILSDCADVYSIAPASLKKEKKSVGVSMTLYPYTKEYISKLVGTEAETLPSLVKLTPVLRIGSRAYTRRAYPLATVESLTSQLFGAERISVEKVGQGEEVKLDLTGYGSLVCDLVLGNAELTWKAIVTFPLPEPKVFTPLSSQEIQSLSKILLTRYQFKGAPLKNYISVSTVTSYELKKLRNIEIDMTSDDPKSFGWTRFTLENLVEGIMDVKTGKPVFINAEKALSLEKALTVVDYEYDFRELLWSSKIKGVK